MRWWACFVILIYALPGLAREVSVSGKVSDSVGAVFENLPVVIKNVSTHKRVVTKTVKTGEFGPVSLPVGVYKVDIRADCFKPYSRTITLSESGSVRLDISLKETCMEPKLWNSRGGRRKAIMEIKKVGVLGCGLMGSGIAQVCAMARSNQTQIVTLTL